MRNRLTTVAIEGTSYAVLLGALALTFPVLERWTGAIWQWYKFAGYSDDGHVNLSIGTGVIFSLFAMSLVTLAVVVHRIARIHSAARAQGLSRWAGIIALAAVVGYWVLALSFLNVWRA